jgi:hypothetical protein
MGWSQRGHSREEGYFPSLPDSASQAAVDEVLSFLKAAMRLDYYGRGDALARLSLMEPFDIEHWKMAPPSENQKHRRSFLHSCIGAFVSRFQRLFRRGPPGDS